MKVCQQERALHDVKKEAAVKLAMLHANAHLKIRNTLRYICISSTQNKTVSAHFARKSSLLHTFADTRAAHTCAHAQR